MVEHVHLTERQRRFVRQCCGEAGGGSAQQFLAIAGHDAATIRSAAEAYRAAATTPDAVSLPETIWRVLYDAINAAIYALGPAELQTVTGVTLQEAAGRSAPCLQWCVGRLRRGELEQQLALAEVQQSVTYRARHNAQGLLGLCWPARQLRLRAGVRGHVGDAGFPHPVDVTGQGVEQATYVDPGQERRGLVEGAARLDVGIGDHPVVETENRIAIQRTIVGDSNLNAFHAAQLVGPDVETPARQLAHPTRFACGRVISALLGLAPLDQVAIRIYRQEANLYRLTDLGSGSDDGQ